MIIISNMIRTIISNSISKISKVNRTSNKTLRTLMGDFRLMSNQLHNLMKDFKLNSKSHFYNNLIKSNKNIMNKTRIISIKKNKKIRKMRLHKFMKIKLFSRRKYKILNNKIQFKMKIKKQKKHLMKNKITKIEILFIARIDLLL